MPAERGITMDLSELTSRYVTLKNFKPATMETVALRTLAEYNKAPWEMTVSDWQEVLSSVKSGNIVYFSRVKHVYIAFLEWLETQGMNCERVLKALKGLTTGLEEMAFDPNYYFKDFSDFLGKFNEVMRNENGEYGKWHTLLSLLVLLWFGVSVDDALALRKEDFLYLDKQGWMITLPSTGEITPIKNPSAVAMLKSYMDAYGYSANSTSRVRFASYAETPYFLRTTKGRLKRNSLNVMINELNEKVRESGKLWRISLIYFPENASSCGQ